MSNQREWPIRVLGKIAPALKWQDGLDIFIAANSEEKTAIDVINQIKP